MPSPVEFLALVENVAPEHRDAMREVFTPKGTCRVAASKNFVYIVSHVLRGLNPSEISILLEKEKREFIPETNIRDYVLQHVPPQLIKTNLLFQYIKKTEQLDEIDVMEVLMKIQLSRVARRADIQDPSPEEAESTRREIDLLQKMTMNCLEAKIKTGRVKAAPKQIDMNVTGNVENKQVVEHKLSIDPRVAARALNVMKKIKQLTANADPVPIDVAVKQ